MLWVNPERLEGMSVRGENMAIVSRRSLKLNPVIVEKLAGRLWPKRKKRFDQGFLAD